MNFQSVPVSGASGRRLYLAGLVSTVVLAGCASLVPKSLDVSQSQILDAVSQRFPYQRKVLEVFDLQLTRPRVAMLPDRNRVGLDLDLGLQDSLLTRREYKGVVHLTTGLRYESGDGTVRLQGVKLERLAMDGLSPGLNARLQQVAGLLAEQQFEGQPIKQFTREQLDRAAMLGVRPGALTVTSSGLSMALEPIQKP